MATWVRLSDRDIADAEAVAARRDRPDLRHAHDLAPAIGESRWLHELGAYGELAAATALGVEWDRNVDTFRSRPNVAGIEVRTRSRSTYDLLIRDNDPTGRLVVLVNGAEAPYWLEVVGWIRAGAARHREFRRSYAGREPAYFVPREKLNGLDSLAQMVRRARR